MLFTEMSSILHTKIAEFHANLAKAERIKLAICACHREDDLTVYKASKIYSIAPSTITQRLKGKTTS